MTRALKIGVDIDDVLYPWYEVAHDICTRAGITNGVTPTIWSPFIEYGCNADTWHAALADATIDGSLYLAEPYPFAADALGWLRDAGHSVHLVTARGFLQHGDAIMRHTVAWLAEHEVPFDTLTFSRDKTLVSVDVFADDSERNIADLTLAGIPACLISAPHNGHMTHPWRCANVAEFAYDILFERTPIHV